MLDNCFTAFFGLDYISPNQSQQFAKPLYHRLPRQGDSIGQMRGSLFLFRRCEGCFKSLNVMQVAP